MNGQLVRGSREHIGEIAKIDIYYNDERDSALKIFKIGHPGVDPQGSPIWKATVEDIEERRIGDFKVMCQNVIDQ